MLYAHFLRKLLKGHIRQLVATPKLKTAPHIKFDYLPGTYCKYFLWLKMVNSFQELMLIGSIMDVANKPSVSRKNSLNPLLQIQKLVPSPSNDSIVLTKLPLPDIHHALLNIIKQCCLNVKGCRDTDIMTLFAPRIPPAILQQWGMGKILLRLKIRTFYNHTELPSNLFPECLHIHNQISRLRINVLGVFKVLLHIFGVGQIPVQIVENIIKLLSG